MLREDTEAHPPTAVRRSMGGLMFGRRTVFGFAAGAALIAATCTGGDDHATPTSEDAPNGAGDAPSATATASCTPLPTAAPVDPAAGIFQVPERAESEETESE